MSLFSRLHGHFDRVIQRLTMDKEARNRLDEERNRNLTNEEWVARMTAESQKWRSPEQLPICAETVFLDQLQSTESESFFGKTRGPMTIDDAWNGLSLEKRAQCTAKAKKNEIHNAAELAKFHKRCPLSPSVEDLSSRWGSLSQRDGEVWLLMGQRRVALQQWKRYRCDHPRAFGGCPTPVPETPFRLMDLPFELRREIFSCVLTRSYPVLQSPPDWSADGLPGPVDVRIFAVSRQVFLEAVKVLYEVNTFSINTGTRRYYKEIPLFIRQSTGNEGPRPSDSIKRVHVSFLILANSIITDDFYFLWQRFCEFLRTCRSLRQVEITARRVETSHDAFDGAIDLQLDKLIEILKSIKSTKKVVFSDVTTIEGRAQMPSAWCVRRVKGMMENRGGGREAGLSANEPQSSTG
ncbi:MAG: hypothetical protein ASARMPREDX12_000227 [Alectoria sarmentosa]|nr:MAG: hypothetical protein ASARMPREDX12_000227 [Alectoria sarmentosa]